MCFPAGRCHGVVVPQYIVTARKRRTRAGMAASRPGDRLHCLNTHRSQPVGALVVKQHFCPQDNGSTDSPAQCATLRPSCYRNPAHRPSDDACSPIRREKRRDRACRPHSIDSTPRSRVDGHPFFCGTANASPWMATSRAPPTRSRTSWCAKASIRWHVRPRGDRAGSDLLGAVRTRHGDVVGAFAADLLTTHAHPFIPSADA